MQVNHDAKEVLAKLLAEEDLSVVFRNVKTASFSLQKRMLTLPIMQNSNQIVNWHVAHEVGHALFTPEIEYIELARRFGSLPNIVEDVRVNDRICDRYKGLKRLKAAAYTEMFDSNFYGNESLTIDRSNVNSLPFPDRINIHYKVGAHAGIKFAEDEMPIIEQLNGITVWSEVEPACKAIAKFMKKKEEEKRKEEEERQEAEKEAEPESSEDADDEEQESAMPIFGTEPEEDEEPEQSQEETEEDDEEELAPAPSFEDEDADEDDSEEDASASGSSDEESYEDFEDSDEDFEEDFEGSEESEEDSDEDFDGGQGAGGDSDGEEDEDVAPTDGTESGSEEDDDDDDDEDYFVESDTVRNEEESFEDSALSQTEKDIYRTIRDYSKDWGRWIASESYFKNMIGRYTTHWKNNEMQMLSDFEKSNKKTIEDAAQTFLINRKIDYSSPEMVYHSGVIDTNKLHSYQIDDNIFLRETIIQDNSSKHGLIMFIDFSSSMQQRLFGTIQQAINLAMFAREAMIPFEVYGFTWLYGDRVTDNTEFNEDIVNPTDHKGAKPVFKIFDDQTDIKDFRKVANDLLFFSKWVNSHRHDVKINDFLHSTPLDASLVLAKYIGEDFKARNGLEKLQFVFLTDGYSDDMGNLPTTYKPEGSRYNELTTLHITDPMLKKTTSVQDKAQGVTKMLSRNLSEYLDAGIVNFFITDKRMYECYKRYDKDELVAGAAVNLGSAFGFEESIMVNEKKFVIESVDVNFSSSRTAKTSFAKKGRIAKTTRILMNDFAERIA